MSRTFLTLIVAAWFASPLTARTIVLTDVDAERVASLGPEGPRLSFLGYESATGVFSTAHVDLTPGRTFLMQYALDRIPPGQRITHAEWIVPFAAAIPAEMKLHVHRVTADWGKGVCHDFRMTRPQKVPWAQPGCRGPGLDRVVKPTAISAAGKPTEVTFNVTEDVELWYTQTAPNHGWTLTTEDRPGTNIRLYSPWWTGRSGFKLRITYEPE